MPLFFYQVGGFYSHVRRNAGNIPTSSNELANKLLGPKANIKLKDDDALQFFLGITPCGASYILLPDQAVEGSSQLRALFKGRPWPSNEFISLSPVYFADSNSLAAKLATLTNKKSKERRDRSTANTAFTTGVSSISSLQRGGIDRATFEYHRVLYQLCRGTITASEYDARTPPWFGDINTMWSFAYNTWSRDQRTLVERQQDPKVLDVSWTEYIPPSGSETLMAINTNHFIVKENRMLLNPEAGTFLHGETLQASHNEIATSLQEIFIEAKRSRPVLLFVHDAKWAMIVLKSFGVDTSEWRLGVEPILGRPLLEKPDPENNYGLVEVRHDRSRDFRSSTTPHYDQRQRSTRSRSPHGRPVNRNKSPPEQQRSPYPVYVVDVKNLYTTMSQLSESASNTLVADIARALRVKYEQPSQVENNPNPNQRLPGWCAGNESRILGYLWSTMVSGNAIDEQRGTFFNRIVHQTHLQQVSKKESVATSSTPVPTPVVQGEGDSDSDRDPNDFAPIGPSSRPNGSAGKDPYASDEDDYYIDF
ncbi:hypothetical protein BDY19DRAFT_920647 [Irpex rosettiformis]|uniref:Uncharacterized protein n=1 Tax=Irpex rosettiformis TaxID=378272 RepID=A0ACB8UIC0_9APHY|nr:hypothetical protein BDY19DRAFT_920647 [Irpex rosettiformis]